MPNDPDGQHLLGLVMYSRGKLLMEASEGVFFGNSTQKPRAVDVTASRGDDWSRPRPTEPLLLREDTRGALLPRLLGTAWHYTSRIELSFNVFFGWY